MEASERNSNFQATKVHSSSFLPSLKLMPLASPRNCSWRAGSQPGISPHNHYRQSELPEILPNVLHAMGNTPMIRLNKIPAEFGIKCEMLVKCEFFNAGGSIKDRIGLRMVEEAEKSNTIKPGATLIEATSGNTGIAVALTAAVKGYNCIITIPENMSEVKINLLRALGAEVVLTPATAFSDDPDSDISVAQKIQKRTPNSVFLAAHLNPGNPLAHYDGTAEEILFQCDNEVDMIVMCAGTGGTITGIGRKIKEKCPNCKIIGADPYGSVLSEPESLNESSSTFHDILIEGFGFDFVPTVLDRTVVDKWVKVSNEESLHMARRLIKKEGLLCGETSGSAMCAAIKMAKNLKEGQRCVVLLTDGVRNYMAKFLSDSWMIEKDFIDINPRMRNKHWWWDLKVSCIKLQTPLTVRPSMTCKAVMDIMNEERINELSVVDDDGVLKGIISLETILKQIKNGNFSPNSYISHVMSNTFQKITQETTLGRLSIILEKNSFAVIVQELEPITNENGQMEKKYTVIGIITRKDFISFVTKKMCQVSTTNASIGLQNGTS